MSDVQGVAGARPAVSTRSLGLWPSARNDPLLVGVLALLVVLAWLSLWLWSLSPHARLLGHETLGNEASPDDSYALLLAAFVAGWTLMTVAMMLPTSLPLVAFFRALVRKRSDSGLLVALLVVGYLIVWVAFAALVHLGDLGVHEVVERVGWLESNSWVIGAATLLWAGLYQFSSLKYRCLEKCRSPVTFVMSHWRGRAERRQALRLGAHHGVFCLGCCWSLMLLMFAVGVGNIGWMLVLAVVTAAEKNAAWGKALSRPLGVLLVLAGIATVGAQMVEHVV